MADLSDAEFLGGGQSATLSDDQFMAAGPATPTVDDDLAQAVTGQESGQRSGLTSPKGAQGLWQVMPDTAKGVAKRLGLEYDENRLLHDDAYNTKIGRAYLGEMLERYGGNRELALAAYNAGPDRVDKWLAAGGQPGGLPDETRKYVPGVLGRLKGGAALASAPAGGGEMTDDEFLGNAGAPPGRPVAPAAAAPTWGEILVGAVKAGLVSNIAAARQTVQGATGKPIDEAAPVDPRLAPYLTDPYDWSLGLPNFKKIIGKNLFGLTESAPEMAGAIAGGVAGTAAVGGPENPLAIISGPVGAGLGAAGVHVAKTMAPIYAEKLKANPGNPDAAFSAAWKEAAQGGAFTGVAFGAFGIAPFQSAVKNVLLQAFGVQPAIGGAEKVATNLEQGRPAGEGVGTAAAEAGAATLIPMVPHMIRDAITGKPRLAAPGEAQEGPPAPGGGPPPSASPGAPGRFDSRVEDLVSGRPIEAPPAAEVVPPPVAEPARVDPMAEALKAATAAPGPSTIADHDGTPLASIDTKTGAITPPAGGGRLEDEPARVMAEAEAIKPSGAQPAPAAGVVPPKTTQEIYPDRPTAAAPAPNAEGPRPAAAAPVSTGEMPAAVTSEPPVPQETPAKPAASVPAEPIPARDETQPTTLAGALAASRRAVLIPGMEGEFATDPIARELLARGAGNLGSIERQLREHGIARLKPLSGGVSSVVLDAGDGRVVRMGHWPSGRRPKIPEILQPLASGDGHGIGWEILPKVDTAGITEADVAAMKARLAAKGYEFSDAGTDNLGRLNGKLVVTDAGAVRPARDVTQPGADHIAAIAAEAHPEPTPDQAKAGNYQKGHVRLHGLDITIENAEGDTRRGVGADGKPWEAVLPGHYGYFKRSTGKDGDHVDIYIGPDPQATRAFVIDQIDPATGKFDEHKVVMGVHSAEEANALYDRAFSDGSGPTRRKNTTPTTVAQLKTWLKKGDTKKPFATAPAAVRVPEAPVEKPADEAPYTEQEATDERADGLGPTSGPPLAGAPAEHGSAPEGGGRLSPSPAERPGAGEGPGVGDGGPGGRPDVGPARGNEEAYPSPERGGTTDLASGQDAIHPAGALYRLGPEDRIGEGSPTEKFDGNVAAIELLKKIEAEGRMATPEEQKVLVRYVGWGGMPQAFDRYRSDATWRTRAETLEKLLSPEEHAAAHASTINAHYTAPAVIKGMWDAVRRLGFKGGRVLEPSVGVGHFFGLMPEDMIRASRLTGIDLDSLSARLAKQLYQSATIHNKGFEEVELPERFFDLAISNVPFADIAPYDKRYNKERLNLHDYFFRKSLELVRPGGVVAFITSKGTLDKLDTKARKLLNEKADLIAAWRLPEDAFKANAGTTVTTDVILLRRRVPGEPAGYGQGFEGTEKVQMHHQELGGTREGTLNEYFRQHPENMAGEMQIRRGRYGASEETALIGSPDADLGKWLAERATDLPGDIMPTVGEAVKAEARAAAIPAAGETLDGGYGEKDGSLYIREGPLFIPVPEDTPTQKKAGVIIRGALGVRDQLRSLLRMQVDRSPGTEAQRRSLNQAYDAFVKKHGAFSDAAARRALIEDPEYPKLAGLEKWDPETKKATKADIFTRNTARRAEPPVKADTPGEALAVALNWKGRVDLGYIGSLLGSNAMRAREQLAGLVYDDPEGGPVTAERYLSGNVRAKLKTAEAAAASDPRYKENVEALRAIQPEDLPPSKIAPRLGAAWIPPDVISSFISELLGVREDWVNTRFVPEAGKWFVTYGDKGAGDARRRATRSSLEDRSEANTTWGTARANFLDLMEHALHGTFPQVFDRFGDDRVLNIKETEMARAKLQTIRAKFADWLWQDGDRGQRMARIYNDDYNNIRLRKYSGEHLDFPGMADGLSLRAHQKAAVWRILEAGNTYLAHEVGTGKTFAMTAAAMEARRLGIARKPMIAVLKSTIDSFAAEFTRLYPQANILKIDVKDNAADRKLKMARIASNDWDAVIVTHESFNKLPVGAATLRSAYDHQINALGTVIGEMAQEEGRGSRAVKEIAKAKLRLEAKLKELTDRIEKDQGLTFEQLGVDMVMIDEAQEFKNLSFATSMGRSIRGLQPEGSGRAFDLWVKSRYLNQEHGRGLVLASGTPISNSVGELFTTSRYLQPSELEARGIGMFDTWANTFGDVGQIAEYLPQGGGYQMITKFTKFVNLPELMQMVYGVMDVVRADDAGVQRPKIEGGVPEAVVVPQNPNVAAYQADLKARAVAIKRDPKGMLPDNMLAVVTDGRKAAIDYRMVDPKAKDHPDTKTNRAVDRLAAIYKETKKFKGVQLVFADLGSPENKVFSVYADLKAKLVKRGIPAGEIAFIHDAKNDAQRVQLFKRINRGDVRIMVGSTKKAGTGVNVQERVAALHHLDVHWNLANYIQRNGRGQRQGNLIGELDPGRELKIINYATEGTVDAFMWDKVKQKGAFIDQVMSGDMSLREAEDISQDTVSANEMVAIASGDPLIAEKVRLESQINSLSAVEAAYTDQHRETQWKLSRAPKDVERSEGSAKRYRDFAASLRRATSILIGGKVYALGKDAEKIEALRREKTKGMTRDTSRGVGPLLDEQGQMTGASMVMRVGDYKDAEPRSYWESADGGLHDFEDRQFGKSAKVTANTLDGYAEKALEEAERIRGEVPKWLAELGKVSPNTEKLRAAEKRYDEIIAALTKREEEQAPTDPDAPGPTDGEPGPEANYWFIQMGDGAKAIPLKDADAVELDDLPDRQFFVRKVGNGWVLSDVGTGLQIADGNTRTLAIKAANDKIDSAGADNIRERLEERPQITGEQRVAAIAEHEGKPGLSAPTDAFAPRPQAPLRPAGEWSDTLPTFERYADMDRGKPFNVARRYVLDQGAADGHEHLVAFDKMGRPVEAGTVRQHNTIAFSQGFLAKIHDPAAEIAAHHNHPSGSPLSLDDVAALGYPGMGSVWAHGEGWGSFGAAMSPEVARWLAELRPRTKIDAAIAQEVATRVRDALGEIYRASTRGADGPLRLAFFTNLMPPEDANMALRHAVLEAMARGGVIRYEADGMPSRVTGHPVYLEALRKAEDAVLSLLERFAHRVNEPIPDDNRAAARLRAGRDMAGLRPAAGTPPGGGPPRGPAKPAAGEGAPRPPRKHPGLSEPEVAFLEERGGGDRLRAGIAARVEQFRSGVLDEIVMAATPMGSRRGSDAARAIATEFESAKRQAAFFWNQFDDRLKKTFGPAERQAMWDAMDEQSVAVTTGALRQDEVRPGIGWGRLDAEQLDMARRLDAYAGRLWGEMRDIGMVEGPGLAHWTPRMIVRAAGGESATSLAADQRGRVLERFGTNVRTTHPSLKHRKYLTAAETEAAAQHSLGPDVMLARDIRTMPLAMRGLEDALAGRRLIKAIKEMSREVGEETVLEDGVTPDQAPRFFTIDNPVFTTLRPQLVPGQRADGSPGMVARLDDQGRPIITRVPIYIRKDFEGPLRAILSKKASPLYQAMMRLKGGAMAAIMYSPLIHNAVEWGRALPLMPGKVFTFRAYGDGARALKDPEVMKAFFGHAGALIGHQGHMQDLSSIMADPNARPGRGLTAQMIRKVIGLASEPAGDAVARLIDSAGDLWHNKLLWDQVAKLQMGIFSHMRQQLRRDHPEMTQDTADWQAAHLANRFAGALPIEAMSATSRKLANLALFSRTFTLGNLGVFKDVATGLPKNIQSSILQAGGELQRQLAVKSGRKIATHAILLDVGLMVAANSILQDVLDYLNGPDKGNLTKIAQGYVDRAARTMKLVRGNPLELLDPFALLNKFGAGGENEPGKEEYILTGYDKDGTAIYAKSPVGKMGMEFTGWMHPIDMLMKKQSTFLAPLVKVMTNSDGFGRPIFDPNDRSVAGRMNALGKIAWTFVGAQFPSASIQSAWDLMTGATPNKETALLKTLGPLGGVTFSSGFPGGPAAGEIYLASKEQQYKWDQARPGVRRLIQQGNIPEAVHRMQMLGLARAQIAAALKYTINPSAMSPRAIRAFMRYASDEDKARFGRLMEQPQP